MKASRRTKRKPLGDLLEDLREQHGRGGGQAAPISTATSALPLAELRVEPRVFQPRVGESEDGAHNPAHVAELVKQIQSKPKDRPFLDPITVWRAGGKTYVLDGHHRRSAYLAEGVTLPVPVRFFEGTLEEARQEAISANAKLHLNLDRADRNEAAWRLVVMDRRGEARLTVAVIAEKTGIKPRSVDRMRALWGRLQAALGERDEFTGEEIEAEFESYAEARARDPDRVEREASEDWLEEITEQWTGRLGAVLGKEPHRNPDIFARALAAYLGEHTLTRVTEALGFFPVDPEEHDRFVEWQAGRGP